jgi:hypothetical protein
MATIKWHRLTIYLRALLLQMTNPKLYPFPAAGTAALVSRGSTYPEGTGNLRDRVSFIVIEGLGNIHSIASKGFRPATSSPSRSGSKEPSLSPLPNEVSLKLR